MVVIVGVGNFIMGDDGFGIHVIEKMKEMDEFSGVDIVDAMTHTGTFLAALDGRKKAIVIDVIGEDDVSCESLDTYNFFVYKFNPNLEEIPSNLMFGLHDVHFKDVLSMARDVYKLPDEIIVVGPRPRKIEAGTELSDSCKKAIDPVIDFVRKELRK